MEETLSPVVAQERYFLAAQAGDVKGIKESLENSAKNHMDIDSVDANGRSALHIAIENGNLAVIYPLLEHEVEIKDALLRAVEHDFGEAVRILCDVANKSLDYAAGRRIIDCHCSNDDFHPYINPIILAAQRNNFLMVKLLLEAGARIPLARDAAVKTASSDSFQRSVGTMEIYKGLASEAYVARASNDPVDRAFTLFDEIRRLGEIEIEFKVSYKELEVNMERFATEFISQTRSTEEIMTVLSHPDEENPMSSEETSHSPLPKISRALDLGLQKFIAHPNCQQVIITQFYKRLLFVRDKGALYRVFFFALLFLLYPFLAVLHVYSDRQKIKTFVRIPVVMFIMYLAADLTFVTLLTWEAVNDSGSAHNLSFTRPYNVAALVWILGMMWREIECIAARGITKIMTQWEHIRDTLIILIFLVGVAFEIVAYFTVPFTADALMTTTDGVVRARRSIETTDGVARARRSVELPPSVVGKNFTDGKYAEIGDYVLGEIEKTEPKINQTTKVQIKEVVRRVMNYTARRRAGGRGGTSYNTVDKTFSSVEFNNKTEDFLNRTWDHPQIMGRAMFALATAFTVLRMLPYCVISDLIGPLQISLVSMIIRTFHFFIVVGTVLGSFAVGLTLTYSQYAEESKIGSFSSIFQSLITLYWSVFGLMPMTDLHLPPYAVVKETSGSLLYASFYVLVIIVLLNALIAVWSNVYNEIEENSDMQWKFSCTAMWMTFLQDDLRVPPPFNLLPTPSAFRRIFDLFSKRGRWAEVAVEEMKPIYDDKWLRTEGVRLFIDGSKKFNRTLEEQTNYSRVIGRLLERYVAEKTADECSTTAEVSKADLRNLKNDLIALRYETFLKLCQVHDQLFTTSKDCIVINKQSDIVPGISDKADVISSDLFHNLANTLEFQSSLAETVAKLPPPSSAPPTPPPDSPLPPVCQEPKASAMAVSSAAVSPTPSRPVSPAPPLFEKGVRKIVVKLVKQFETGQISTRNTVNRRTSLPVHSLEMFY